ncbi:MAG: lipB [Gammaproteobacteria bacterium]|jgi:lipoyl(octanoyl) transferase|nr:lipB [Gammaproteobacteria bacterium]
MPSIEKKIIIRQLGLQAYPATWQAMQAFTNTRNKETVDEIWLLEHPPVFTQGQNGKPEHLLNPGSIPVIQTDRGGQVTYHGPGQLIVYTLIDLKRKKLNIREIITLLEQTVIQFLFTEYQITAYAKREAPGVYIDEKKICSIGLRIRHGCTFHGLALNVAMDLEPFSRINPCGFPQLAMTQLVAFQKAATSADTSIKLIKYLMKNLGYNNQLIM